jgi:hypothetical protein
MAPLRPLKMSVYREHTGSHRPTVKVTRLTLNGPRAALVLGAEIKTAATAISGRKSGSFERRKSCPQSAIERMTLAGFPPTRVLGGTFLVTTEPAATTEFSPTVTPPMIVAPAAIHTFLSITMGLRL